MLRVLAAGSVLAAGEEPGEFAPADPRAPAFIQLTSGSTGHPRGAVISHAALIAHLTAISQALPLAGPDARCVTWLRCITTWASSAACCIRCSTALR